MRTHFANDPEKDFTKYINVMKAAGLKAGATVLDFGCSWGCGSWQFRNAGFQVYSCEISQPRARYAKNTMGCNVVEDVSQIPEPIDCLFSSHVIEHLADPGLIWRIADKVMREDGIIVVFCPNGEPSRESVIGRKRYDWLWPQVHPMVITPRFVRTISREHGYLGRCFSNPYDFEAIAREAEPPELLGDELCLIAKRVGSHSVAAVTAPGAQRRFQIDNLGSFKC